MNIRFTIGILCATCCLLAASPRPVQSKQSFTSDILFFGDSLTAMVNWQQAFPEYQVINEGVPGDTTKTANQRLKQILQKQTPRTMFIMLGINDLFQNPPLHVPARAESYLNKQCPAAKKLLKYSVNKGNALYWSLVAIPRGANSYTSLLKTIRSQSPDTRIFVQSILPTNDNIFYRNHQFQIGAKTILSFNKRVKRIAAAQHLEFIDLYPYLTKNNELNPDFTGDGVHLNEAGNRIWCNEIRKHVR